MDRLNGAGSTSRTKVSNDSRKTVIKPNPSSLNAGASSKSAGRHSRRVDVSTGSHSRSTNQVGGNSYPIQIILADGSNVTPRPLLPAYLTKDTDDLGMASKVAIVKNTGEAVKAIQIDDLSELDLDNYDKPAKAGGGGLESNQRKKVEGINLNEPIPSPNAMGSMLNMTQHIHSNSFESGPKGMSKHRSMGAVKPSKYNMKGAAMEEEDKGLDIMESIKLTETATITLLDISGLVVATDAKERAQVEARNNRYTALVGKRASGAKSDGVGSRHTQTLYASQKSKEVHAATLATREFGCMATTFDIHDEHFHGDLGGEEGMGPEEVPAGGAGGAAAIAPGIAADKKVQELVQVALASKGCLLDVTLGIGPGTSDWLGKRRGSGKPAVASSQASNNRDAEGEDDPKQILKRHEKERILSSPSLLRSLMVAERAVKQTEYHGRQLQFRDQMVNNVATEEEPETPASHKLIFNLLQEDGLQGLPTTPGSDVRSPLRMSANVNKNIKERSLKGTKREPRVDKLWDFRCPLTRNRVVHALCWCRGRKPSQPSLAARHDHVARDLLAVGYSEVIGPIDTSQSPAEQVNAASGLVLFWSLRNPQHPERILNLRAGVTTLDFSTHHPNLLAVGLRDGSILIFDMHKEDQYYREPILDTSTLEGRHTDPVWQLKWVDKGLEQDEGLVSISTDGHIVEWSTSKGLSAVPLMTLKRVSMGNNNLQGKISNQANGLSFDFLLGDPSVYLASTEDGLIHRCSVSYNEQYLETYVGHTAPVYKVVASPFWSQAFASCAGDWTVRVWNTKQDPNSNKNAVLVLNSSTELLSSAVHDVVWSRHSPTLLASVTGDGRLMIWDLAVSTIDPVVVEAWTPTPEPPPSTAASSQQSEGGIANMDDARASTPLSPLSETHSARPETNDDVPAAGDSRASVFAGVRPEFTSVVFNDETPLVAVGDSMGGVSCYKMVDVVDKDELQHLSMKDKANKLRLAMYPEMMGGTPVCL